MSAPLNAVATTVADGRHTPLVAALQAAELDDDLRGDGPFIRALREPGARDDLAALLTVHVVSGDD